MKTPVQSPPLDQAIHFLQWLHDGEPFEICIIGPKQPTSKLWEGRANGKSVVAGWFTDAETAAKLACQAEAKGVYVTLNPTKDELLGRAENRLKAGVDRTADKFIANINNLLIDIDPERASGISSTDDEHSHSLQIAIEIKDDLGKLGWPEPLIGDSGNGAHLIYPISLQNTEENKTFLKSVLAALSLKYEDRLKPYNLQIDTTVFNPARLTKLYGTWTRKGDNTNSRPHRIAKLINIPPKQTVPLDKLIEIAALVPKETPPQTKSTNDNAKFDVKSYLEYYGKEIIKTKEHGSSTLYCLQECLFDPSHQPNEAYIGQTAEGKIFYKCFHNSCQSRTWAEARHIISGNDHLGKFAPAASRAFESPPSRGAGLSNINTSSSIITRTFSIEELRSKVSEILKKSKIPENELQYVLDCIKDSSLQKSLTDEVTEWIMTSKGLFLTSDVHKELHLTSRDLKKQANEVCRRLMERGKITACGGKRGCYRVVEEGEEMDWQSADIENFYPIKWPFALENWVKIFPGNIVVVAGEKNAGKSAFIYNTIKLNQYTHKVVLHNSEASREELKLRLSLHDDIRVQDWKFKAFKRSSNFSDGIFPNRLNIIDYFEFNDEAKFFEIAGEIRKIHDKLNKGICIIALQKKKGAEFGRGGDFSREKARMYLTLGGGKLKIVDGKIWASDRNPNGEEFSYKLIGGWKFIEWE